MIKNAELPTPNTDYPSFYRNFYEVVREDAEPIVKNEEVRAVMQLIDQVFSLANA